LKVQFPHAIDKIYKNKHAAPKLIVWVLVAKLRKAPGVMK